MSARHRSKEPVFSNGFYHFTEEFFKPAIIILAAVFSCVLATGSRAETISVTSSDLGVIKGMVRDNGGSPIADATVAIFRAGTSKLLKQVQSASDGSFLAKIIPGTYTVLAVAQGFNPVTLFDVEVGRSSELDLRIQTRESRHRQYPSRKTAGPQQLEMAHPCGADRSVPSTRIAKATYRSMRPQTIASR